MNLLIKQNLIRVEKINRQKYKLYLNDKNILLKIKIDLIHIKDYFYHLIYLVTEAKKNNNTTDFENDILPNILINVYYQIINSYIIQILLKWSNEFKNDDTTINRINYMVFFDLIEINLEFGKRI
jgi:hypothetical protein